MRKCPDCGKEFDSDKVTELNQYADHSAEHNLSPAQWTDIYRGIQRGKDLQKKKERLDKDAD